MPRRLYLEATSLQSQTVRVLTPQAQEQIYNLLEKLNFSDDIQTANEQHPGLQTYFESIAAEISADSHRFEEITLAKWWAHHRHYARLYLLAKGHRDTADALRDTVIRFFSDDVVEDLDTRSRITHVSYRGFLMDEMGVKEGQAKFSTMLASHTLDAAADPFGVHLWRFVDAGDTFEVMQAELAAYREEVAKAKALAKALSDRGYRIGDFIRMLLSTPNGTNPPSHQVREGGLAAGSAMLTTVAGPGSKKLPNLPPAK